MKIRGNLVVFAFFSIIAAGCVRDPLKVDVSGIRVNAKPLRFEKDLFETTTKPDLQTLEIKYGSFTDIFIHRILNIPEAPDSVVELQLNEFIKDQEVSDIYRMTDSVYNNVEDIESGMEDFLKHLSYYYPEKPVPGVVTFISAFNYAVITTDSVIGIGLDMFLGNDVFYYPRLGIPKYVFSRFSREYIIPSAIKAWYQSEYDIAAVKNECLSQMIYQGKLLYFTKVMSPALHDSLIHGYALQQLNWCNENEANVWSFLIENKMLFNTDPSQFAKFVNDGPTTSGFPKESPGKIGAYIGWKIVTAYAEKNNEITVPEIMNENDAQKILEKSGYKPQK